MKLYIKSILIISLYTVLYPNDLIASKHGQSFSLINNCLEAYYGKPGELLTIDLLEPIIDFEGEDPEISNAYYRNEDTFTTNCKWYINKQRRIIRLQSIIKMKLYDKTAIDRFYQKYHTMSESEKAELKETYKKEVVDKSTVENANIIGDAMDFDFEYYQVDGIGDAAVWEHKVNNLIVLVGEYQFTVNVKISDDNALNMEKAKLIAVAIINKACQ